MSAARYDSWWLTLMKCILPLRSCVAGTTMFTTLADVKKIGLLNTDMRNGKTMTLKLQKPAPAKVPKPEKTKGQSARAKKAQASPKLPKPREPKNSSDACLTQTHADMKTMRFPEDVNWIIDHACVGLKSRGWDADDVLRKDVTFCLQHAVQLLFASPKDFDMMKFGDIECKRWSQMKKLVWKRMANASKEFLQDNPESNPGVSREKRRLVPQHVADDVGNAKPFNMLEARDFFATEMTGILECGSAFYASIPQAYGAMQISARLCRHHRASTIGGACPHCH